VITNVPGADELLGVALRLYFSAWSSLIGLTRVFEDNFPQGETAPSGTDNWAEERKEYLTQAQPDLQSVCAIIQQSNELALKARISEVSPFLLLVGSDHRFSAAPRDVDFADFRTIDAVELPRAVNSICAVHLSGQFVQTYNYIRSLRNRIAYVGVVNEMLQPKELQDILVDQYIELWPDRHWLQDRLACESMGASAFFHDGQHSSAHLDVLYEWPYTITVLGNAKFKRLFGHPKSKRRYLCHACIDEARTTFAELDSPEYATAFLRSDKLHVDCAMCGRAYRVINIKCQNVGCKGVYAADNGDEYNGICHSCGEQARA
jgi:hypothetical protein